MKKTIEVKEISAKNKKEIAEEIVKANQKLAELRFSNGFGKLKNLHEISMLRKRIARLNTFLNLKITEEILKELK